MAYNYLKLTDFTPDKFTVYIKLQLNSVPGFTFYELWIAWHSFKISI